MNIRILGVARAEAIDIADAYNQQTPGLGDRFLEALGLFVANIVAQPRVYPRVRQPTRGREVREGMIPGFLYVAVYEITATDAAVLSITHARRRSKPWRQRLSNPPAS